MPALFASLKTAWPPPDAVREVFQRPRFVRLRLDRFPIRIGNRHIDVALGSGLGGAASAYRQSLWGKTVVGNRGRGTTLLEVISDSGLIARVRERLTAPTDD